MSKQSLVLAEHSKNELVNTLDDALSLGEIVAKSGMFPDVQTQAQAVVKILAGRELGIPAMAALRGIHVIKGKSEIGAGLLAAMIKASGKYDYTIVQHDEKQCELAWHENGKLTGRSVFTIEDAKRAKLLKPDSNWEKFPKAMLFARALTAGQRAYAPDVAIGAAYAPGEVESGEVFEMEPLVITIPPEQIPQEAVPADALFGPLNRAHNTELAESLDAICNKLITMGVKGRPMLERVNALLLREVSGRTVETRYALTDSEATAVIYELESWHGDLISAAQESV